MVSLTLFFIAAVTVFVGEVFGGVDFAHVPWSLFLAYLGLASRELDLN